MEVIMYPKLIVNAISSISPILGAALTGPLSVIAGRLISSTLGGVDMQDSDDVKEKLKDNASVRKLKELELQFSDIQNARATASQQQGFNKYVYFFLAIIAHLAI